MRKGLAIVLTAAMLLCMTACGQLSTPITTTEPTTTTTEAVTTTTAKPTTKVTTTEEMGTNTDSTVTTTAKQTTKRGVTVKTTTTEEMVTTTDSIVTTMAKPTTKRSVTARMTTTKKRATTTDLIAATTQPTTKTATAAKTTVSKTTVKTTQNTTTVSSNAFFLDSETAAMFNPDPDAVSALALRQLLLKPNSAYWTCRMPSSWEQQLKQTNYVALTKHGSNVGRILHKSATSLASGASTLQEFTYQNRVQVKLMEYKATDGMAEVYRATVTVSGTNNETVVLEVDRHYVTADAFGEMALSFCEGAVPVVTVSTTTTPSANDGGTQSTIVLDKKQEGQMHIFQVGRFSYSGTKFFTYIESILDSNQYARLHDYNDYGKDIRLTDDFLKKIKKWETFESYDYHLAVYWGAYSKSYSQMILENGFVPVVILTRPQQDPYESSSTFKVNWYELEKYLTENFHPNWLYRNAAHTQLSPFGEYAMVFLLWYTLYGEVCPNYGYNAIFDMEELYGLKPKETRAAADRLEEHLRAFVGIL